MIERICRTGERRRQSRPARALCRHDVPDGGRRRGPSGQRHRGPHRVDHARPVHHAELFVRAARPARRMGDVLDAEPEPGLTDIFALVKKKLLRSKATCIRSWRTCSTSRTCSRPPRQRGRPMSPRFEPAIGRYLHLDLLGRPHRLYVEEAGQRHSAVLPAHRRLRRPAVSRPAQRRAHHQQLSRHRVRHAMARQILAAGGLGERGIQAHLARLCADDPGSRPPRSSSTGRW